MRDTDRPMAGQLKQVFGAWYKLLGPVERKLLVADAHELCDELNEGDGCATFNEVACELARRIGGPASLPSYVACLVAQRDRELARRMGRGRLDARHGR